MDRSLEVSFLSVIVGLRVLMFELLIILVTYPLYLVASGSGSLGRAGGWPSGSVTGGDFGLVTQRSKKVHLVVTAIPLIPFAL